MVLASGDSLEGAEVDLLFTKVVYDSREVVPGNLFVALPGLSTNGHRYINDALASGAATLLVNQKWLREENEILPVPCLAVKDTLIAFQLVAGWWTADMGDPLKAGEISKNICLLTRLGS